MQCKISKLLGCCILLVLPTTYTNLFAASKDMDPKPASPATIAAQANMRASLPLDNGQDDDFTNRGFIATLKDPVIKAADGHVVWDADRFDWIKGEAPATVNPSLWRQMKLHRKHGLFKVTDNVWQIRSLDGSNMTIVGGKTGWIIIDPLMVAETAKAALALLNEQLGKRPVTAVIYSHDHIDHYGGVRAVVDPTLTTPIIAPSRFIEELVSESLIAGNVVGRRVTYQFGTGLKPGPQGNVGGGISVTTSVGQSTLIPPTDLIKETGDTRVIDGVTFEFQMVPETEAPAEMNFYLPEQRTLFISEIATCTLHNVQTPRGALVRDSLKWAGYLTEALARYGDRTDFEISGHCWPHFGNDVVKNYLSLQRDNYKFIHDQTVRLMNMGETPTEIAEEFKLPPALANEWSNHGYYGTYRHNVKGVYQRYIGWWDGNPAHLNMYPPVEQGKRYVAAMGGATGVLRVASAAMKSGDYRWSAEILNHLVFANPANQKAKALLADSYEQMGYQAESAVWRNYYLTGASELRGDKIGRFAQSSPDLVAAMSTTQMLDLLATRLNPSKIGTREMTMAIDVTDRHYQSLISVKNAVLVAEAGKSIAAPAVSLTGTQAMLNKLFIRKLPLEQVEADGLKVSGDRAALLALQDAIETPPLDYPIVTP